jgi:hypothetical protein
VTIDDLTPAQRIEAQEHYLLRDTKRRDFRASGQPERRRKTCEAQPRHARCDCGEFAQPAQSANRKKRTWFCQLCNNLLGG